MKTTFLSAMLAATLVVLGAATPAAHAGGSVSWSVGVSSGPGVVYAPAPPVYAYPQPVYVQPQPVYVEPAPVVVYGSPGYVTYGQPYYVEQRPRHHHHHRDYNGGSFRQGNDYSR